MFSGCKKVLGLVAAVGFGLLGASNAHAGYTNINAPWPGEKSQSDILSHSFGGTFTADGLNYSNGKVTASRVSDCMDQVFHFDISSIKTLATFSDCTEGLAIRSGKTEQQLFDCTGKGFNACGTTGKIDMPNSYSLVRTGTNSEWSSDQSQNWDGADHLVTYKLAGKGIKGTTYVMFWEDGSKCYGDFDFNDLAVEVKATNCATVPLPAAAWSGLATLAGGVVVTGYKKARRQMA